MREPGGRIPVDEQKASQRTPRPALPTAGDPLHTLRAHLAEQVSDGAQLPRGSFPPKTEMRRCTFCCFMFT